MTKWPTHSHFNDCVPPTLNMSACSKVCRLCNACKLSRHLQSNKHALQSIAHEAAHPP